MFFLPLNFKQETVENYQEVVENYQLSVRKSFLHCAILQHQNISRKNFVNLKKCIILKTIKNEKINFWLNSHSNVW